MTDIRHACAYVRVSREKEDGLSPEQQKEKAELQARLMGIDLIRVYSDIDISGRSDQRPAFQEMIRDIKKKQYDVCLVYKLDRFCRNVRDFQHYVEILESNGCSLVSISQNIDTSTPVGRLLRNILADFAQFESEMIAERTRDNKIAAAKKGRWNGGHVPFGFRVVDKHLEVNPEESDAVKLIFNLRGKGLGFNRIAKELTARGYKPRYGSGRKSGHWTQGAVRSITENPIHKGDLIYSDIVIPGALPATVDTETWESAQVLRVLPGRAQQSPHLLTGLLFCTHCQTGHFNIMMSGRNYIRKADGEVKTRKLQYICHIKREDGVKTCTTKRLDMETLHNKVLSVVFSLSDENILNEEIEAISKPEVNVGEDIKRIKTELDNVRSLMGELFTDYYDHRLMTREQFALKNGEYLEKEKLLMEKLEEIQKDDPEMKTEEIQMVADGVKNLRDNWDMRTRAEQRLSLRKIIKRIDVYPDRIDVDFFAFRKTILPTLNTGSTLIF